MYRDFLSSSKSSVKVSLSKIVGTTLRKETLWFPVDFGVTKWWSRAESVTEKFFKTGLVGVRGAGDGRWEDELNETCCLSCWITTGGIGLSSRSLGRG